LMNLPLNPLFRYCLRNEITRNKQMRLRCQNNAI
jgi:hypothetical protein